MRPKDVLAHAGSGQDALTAWLGLGRLGIWQHRNLEIGNEVDPPEQQIVECMSNGM